MKLSIFTTATRPEIRGDAYNEAIKCYEELADELVVINGDGTWPQEFNWPNIGEHFQRGYKRCTGDFVIHADLDFIFHEKDFDSIRQTLEAFSDHPAVSFYKYQFILPDRYNLKSRLVIAVNKAKYGDRIKFDGGGESDLCQPSLDGKLILPEDVPESKIAFYNYEKLTKSKEQIMDDVGRMDRAYFRYYGKYVYGHDGNDNSAYEGWLKMVTGRFNKPQQPIDLSRHPIYVQDTIKNLTPKQWGYNGLGNLPVNNYAKA